MLNDEGVRVLLAIVPPFPQPHTLTIVGQGLAPSPFHFTPLAPCSLRSCYMSFLDKLCFLVSWPWLVVASLCNALCPLPFFKLMPHLSSPLNSRIPSSGEGFPIGEACPSSCPSPVLHYMSSTDSIALLPSTSLSM